MTEDDRRVNSRSNRPKEVTVVGAPAIQARAAFVLFAHSHTQASDNGRLRRMARPAVPCLIGGPSGHAVAQANSAREEQITHPTGGRHGY